LLLIFSLFFTSNLLQAQWTLENELDCDFEFRIDCDDGSSQVISINSSGGYGFWGTSTNIPLNSISCPCTNPVFTITTSNSGFGNGNQSFSLNTYLSTVSSIFGGSGSVDPNDVSDPNNPFIYCCCFPCS
jgi:hypothetical protein